MVRKAVRGNYTAIAAASENADPEPRDKEPARSAKKDLYSPSCCVKVSAWDTFAMPGDSVFRCQMHLETVSMPDFISGGDMNSRVKVAAAKAEKKQQKLESGTLSEVFPKVSIITVAMRYAKTGVLEPLTRTVNFTRDSAALFKISCLCADCPESGFDFSSILKTMVTGHKTSAKGTINCENCPAPECSDVAYAVTIKYL
ncbi:MAG: hypothetical protein FD164_2357 [Nitrospirae bacterium]|nr:MAG: hypothetical protein FD164_2357 [Nitrospirota bacterium]